LEHPYKFQRVLRLGSVTARHQPNFAALNRGHHLCLAGWPSGWALAHILVTHKLEASNMDAVIIIKFNKYCKGVVCYVIWNLIKCCPTVQTSARLIVFIAQIQAQRRNSPPTRNSHSFLADRRKSRRKPVTTTVQQSRSVHKKNAKFHCSKR